MRGVSVLMTTGLHAHYVIGQDQDNRRVGIRPNQGREPPLIWSVEFMKKVHVASNDTAPLVFPLVVWWNPTFTGSLAMLRYAPRLIESQRLQFEHRAGDIGERRSIRIDDLEATVQCLTVHGAGNRLIGRATSRSTYCLARGGNLRARSDRYAALGGEAFAEPYGLTGSELRVLLAMAPGLCVTKRLRRCG